jgi:hypothetical protein
MRARFLPLWLVAALAAGCASKPSPQASSQPAPPPVSQASAQSASQANPGAAQTHEECAGRMYASRSRGAVHWQIYENCLKERQ